MNKFITHYFSANQQRLELLYIAFRKHKNRDPEWAKRLFQLFSHGLEQQIAWNQALLFPVLQAHNDSQLNELIHKAIDEHQQIKDQVSWVYNLTEKGLESHDDEQRLEYLLSDHFENQEFNLYPACDKLFDVNAVTHLIEQLASSEQTASQ